MSMMNFLRKLFSRPKESESRTLDSFMRTQFKSPCLVSMDTPETGTDALVLLEGVRKIRFALIEVVRGTLSSHGADAETKPDREPLIGVEFFIPVTCPGHVTTLNKLYFRTRIQSMEELTECLYPTAYACEGLRLALKRSEPACYLVRSIPIPTGTALQLTYEQNDHELDISATDLDGELYQITEDKVQNLEVKSTRTSMPFKELILSSPLPRAVQFNSIDQSDCATSSEDEREALVRALDGLIKVKQVEDFNLIVGWRNTEPLHFEAMLIPFERAKDIKVFPYSFKTPDSESNCISNKFHNCNFDHRIGNKLYRKQPDASQITTIQCVVLSSILNEYIDTPKQLEAYEATCLNSGAFDCNHRYDKILESHETLISAYELECTYEDI